MAQDTELSLMRHETENTLSAEGWKLPKTHKHTHFISAAHTNTHFLHTAKKRETSNERTVLRWAFLTWTSLIRSVIESTRRQTIISWRNEFVIYVKQLKSSFRSRLQWPSRSVVQSAIIIALFHSDSPSFVCWCSRVSHSQATE